MVYALAESPVKAGVLWAGTDEGKLWRTDDDGGTWTDLTSSVPAAAKGSRISSIAPSAADVQVAYMSVDAHREGNYAPLVYRTADGGKTWTSIASNLPAESPVKVVREDSKNPKVLFLGTEFGLWTTVDGGRSWFKLGDLPTVAVDDIHMQERDRDLIIATHGRSLYVIDDVGGLELLTPAVRAEPAHLFPPRPTVGFVAFPGFVDSNGNAVFRGSNPPEGALLTFWLSSYSPEVVKISITNSGRSAGRESHGARDRRPQSCELGPEAHEGRAHGVRWGGEQAGSSGRVHGDVESRSSLEHGEAQGELCPGRGNAVEVASKVDFRTVLFGSVAVRDRPFRRRT